ncbi:MAG: hypothetical protein AMXMBFR58_34170 [Phycisphaerae bacterium]|nr:hypothetical protein [Phycisphaerales bacterium]MCK6476324.1 hypothetical protein [Phycisphaerales bacterium]
MNRAKRSVAAAMAVVVAGLTVLAPMGCEKKAEPAANPPAPAEKAPADKPADTPADSK